RVYTGTHQLLSALAHVHKKGFVHRDVKPLNVMLESDLADPDIKYNHWVLTDFNVASEEKTEKEARLDSLYTTASATSLTGFTQFYASPEQLRGEKIDERSDLYSLAVTFFEALTGELPMGANIDPHEINPNLSRNYADFFKKALQRDPKKRFKSAEEMKEALILTEKGKYGGGTIF
ncbi:MAG TPA: serine/threonine-protein kinase, partial [Candidatus Nanoarchaeia archaeon]|nr:serine/threonine-protein kinase [Candidatus Nanoarchaeia archaeon]